MENKKLIEVGLPLDPINEQAHREKYIRKGHPSSLHTWWARRPLAACRAVLFASLVDDPSTHPAIFDDEAAQDRERRRLFDLIEKLVNWDNTTNKDVFDQAREEIAKSALRRAGKDVPQNLTEDDVRHVLQNEIPIIVDPFSGGGSIPLEAQRLGLHVLAGDLNPIPTLITRALTELPHGYSGVAPRNPEAQKQQLIDDDDELGFGGLGEDVIHYGEQLADIVRDMVAGSYPDVTITEELVEEYEHLDGLEGETLPVEAWLWARTITCPNPGCSVTVPLTKSFRICKKEGREGWVKPSVTGDDIDFSIAFSPEDIPEGTVSRSGAQCLACETPIDFEYIRGQGRNGSIGEMLMATIIRTEEGYLYLPPTEGQVEAARAGDPPWVPEEKLPVDALGFRVQNYGISKYHQLFNHRQLMVLSTFAEQLSHVQEQVEDDTGDPEYARVVSTFLGFVIGRLAEYNSKLTYWDDRSPSIQKTFSLPTLQMRWGFPETNPFGNFSGNWGKLLQRVAEVLDYLPEDAAQAEVRREDAQELVQTTDGVVICTDPPYYDNIGYAALSDYFYVWLKRALSSIHPDLFETILTPKQNELIAEPGRHQNSEAAAEFFETGLTEFFNSTRDRLDPGYPMTTFYAFKQREEMDDGGSRSTGWETFLKGLMQAGLTITGTWPLRTEVSGGLRNVGRNSLASSVVLSCRPRAGDAGSIPKREFLSELRSHLEEAVEDLQKANIAPVDMPQAALGPGMSVYSQYDSILQADGSKLPVGDAISIINREVNDILGHAESEMDPDTQFGVTWFEQHRYETGKFGEAEVVFKAKGVSGKGVGDAGIADVKGGNVRLLRRQELPPDWDPKDDDRLTVWECTQHLIRTLENEGEEQAAELLTAIRDAEPGMAEDARDLAYRLYSICERKDWADEALAYNNLVVEWPRLQELAARGKGPLDEFVEED